ALVALQHLLEELLVAARCGLDDLATLEPQADVFNLAAAVDRRETVADRALNRILDRRGEDLTVREVALAVGVHPGAPLDAEPQVGIRAGDVDLLLTGQPVDQAGLLARGFLPASDRVVVGIAHVTGAVDEI